MSSREYGEDDEEGDGSSQCRHIVPEEEAALVGLEFCHADVVMDRRKR